MVGVTLTLPESEGTPKLFLTDGKDGLGWAFLSELLAEAVQAPVAAESLWFRLESPQGDRVSLSPVCSCASGGKNSSFTSIPAVSARQEENVSVFTVFLQNCLFFGGKFASFILHDVGIAMEYFIDE